MPFDRSDRSDEVPSGDSVPPPDVPLDSKPPDKPLDTKTTDTVCGKGVVEKDGSLNFMGTVDKPPPVDKAAPVDKTGPLDKVAPGKVADNLPELQQIARGIFAAIKDLITKILARGPFNFTEAIKPLEDALKPLWELHPEAKGKPPADAPPRPKPEAEAKPKPDVPPKPKPDGEVKPKPDAPPPTKPPRK